MKNIHEQVESETLKRVRDRYEATGYRVRVKPRSRDVPQFLEGFEPDAIATKGKGGVVIEIKSSGRAATRSAIVEFLAREVPKHKGWSFDLVLADKEGIEPPASLQPSRREILAGLDEVETLVREGNEQVALLYGWALLEATTRLIILREEEEKRFLPRTVVEAVASNAFVTTEEEHNLLEIGRLRTWLIHGFTRVTVSRNHINLLVNVARRLLGQETNQPKSTQ
jgi:hypothetical protein